MATLREKMRAKGELLLAHAPILTLGLTMVSTLSLMTLATATALSTGLRISGMENNTSEGSTSGSIESLEVNLGELKVRAIGKNTTEALTNLMMNAVELEMVPSRGRYYQSTLPKAL